MRHVNVPSLAVKYRSISRVWSASDLARRVACNLDEVQGPADGGCARIVLASRSQGTERKAMIGKALIIEGEPEAAGELRALLTGLDLEVHGASDGAEGVRTFLDELPDVVFLNLALQGRAGV